MTDSDRIPKALLTPLVELEQALADWAKGNVTALAVLSKIEDPSNSFQEFFERLDAVFAFDRALVLEDLGDGLNCTAAEPPTLAGGRWPGLPLGDALHVQVLRKGSPRNAQKGPNFLWELAGSEEPALCVPIGVNGRPALLVMVRPHGAEDFDDNHIAGAKQCATVVLATLVARKGKQFEAEIIRLNGLIEQQQQNYRLLKQIIDHLPISLTVQDADGRFILANAMAAATLGMAPEALIGSSPSDFLSEEEAASRREWEQNLIRQNKAVCAEANVFDGKDARTLLTSHNPVRILDRKLVLSSAIDITEYKQAERDLVERAHIDKLTGLPDRILIQEHVGAILRNDDGSSHFALAFIDLDNFKHINDYYNHAVGDGLLVKIGQRVSKRLRPGDMLARISGDEFLLLLNLDSEKLIRPVIDEILNDLKQPFYIDGFEVFSSCSIGVSLYPEHGRTYDVLRRNADNAMYRAKHAAKGEAIVFDVNIAQAVNARMEVEQRLRLAIRDRKFCCAFQPKVNIHTQQVVGFETLVRWRDEDGEIHPPGEFIELAGELGLINSITNFVLAEAVNSIERLDVAFGPDTNISINVAAKQANDFAFMQSFTKALGETNYADRIIVELTEDAFIAKGAFQTKILPILREIGVRVSIDDFGTGYSSLSALADITADEIKIDRSFISGIHERPRNQSVLRAIESLGHALGMTIVAEGVETYEELTYLLAATRIRYVQGFYFSKPIYLEAGNITQHFEVMHRVSELERGRLTPPGSASSRVVAPARSRG